MTRMFWGGGGGIDVHIALDLCFHYVRLMILSIRLFEQYLKYRNRPF